MGQQQLLLIALGVIIIGVAVMVGIQLFNANSIEQKRELLIAECMNLATMAQKYFKTPKEYGGGGGDFSDWDINQLLTKSANGDFEITAESSTDHVTINAKGNISVSSGELVEVNVTVYGNNFDIDIVH